MARGTLAPLFFLDPVRGIGVAEFADFLITEFPNAARQFAVLKDPNVAGGDPGERLVARVWKVLSDRHLGQISYLRILQGTIKADMAVPNPRGGRPLKLAGLSHVFGKDLQPIESAGPGAIVAVTRLEDLAVGDTIVSEGEAAPYAFPLPRPFTTLAVRPKSRNDEQKIGSELAKIAKEDPTFLNGRHPDTHEMLVSGLSDLHLHTCLHRLEGRGVGVETSLPRIAYQETVTGKADGHYRHKKQTGGSGQYGRVAGFIEPLEEGEYEFVNKVTGGAIPSEFIGSIDKGFKQCLRKGPLAGFPINGVRVTINDGASHSVDSSDNAFQQAGIGAFRDGFGKAAPVLLEPIMKVVVEGPTEFQGNIMGGLNQRRGIIIGTFEEGAFTVVEAEVPLADMFGYSTVLRSGTQGKAEFTMEFASYRQLPKGLMDEVIKEAGERKKTSVA